jgi:hypothetical protein
LSLYEFDGTNSKYFGPFNDYSYFTLLEYFEYEDNCYFEFETDGKGLEIHKFDGVNPPEMLIDFTEGASGSTVHDICEHDGDIYINIIHDDSSRYEIIKYDGIAVEKVDVGLENPKGLFSFNNRVYTSGFSDSAMGRDLYSFSFYEEISTIDNLELPHLEVYPNPGKNKLNIGANLIGDLRITDALGKVVLDQKYIGVSIDVSQVLSGVYYITLSNESASYGARWVKE